MLAADFQQALTLHQVGRLAEAEALYRKILAAYPRHADATHYLGMIAFARREYGEAYRLVSEALKLQPGNAAALNNRASILLGMGRPAEALAEYDRALTLDPGNADALSNRGNALIELGRAEDALAALDRAVAAHPRHAAALYNRGNALMALDRRDDAIGAYDTALAITPTYADALFNRAKALLELGRPKEALVSLDRLRTLAPAHAAAAWMQSLCLLLDGDFARGWEKYEARWNVPPQINARRDFRAPLWLGRENLGGKTILLHAEQGFGDTLQFCRYAALVAERGARVILEVQPQLKTLLTGLTGAAQVLAHGEPLPAFDLHCPLLSLPLALQTTLATIPASAAYVHPDAARVAAWRAKLGVAPGRRVGLAWSGRPTHPNDKHRSLAPDHLAPLLSSGATLVSLQKDHRPADEAWLAAHPEVLHFEREQRDFADTAALASLMDVVVAADTAVAHLAGALGLPVWILLPQIAVDFRWMLGRDDSPWYPSARLYRQTAMNDWPGVITRVAADLTRG
jgi:tetratricopeptide (TPR) repeat protein